MRDLAAWSLPIGRVSGILVRVHLLFLFLVVVMALRGLAGGYFAEALLLQLMLFGCVLLHEFGHCFAARTVDGDATEILMWPLGGLASVDVPNTPRAHLITVLGGPAVNLVLFLAAAAGLAASGWLAPLDPRWHPIVTVPGALLENGKPKVERVTCEPLYDLRKPKADADGVTRDVARQPGFIDVNLARFFWVNWILFWFNMLLVGFPMDSGRILQCILWPRLGFREATKIAVYCGYAVSILLALYVFVTFEKGDPEGTLLLLSLAIFIFLTCRQQAFLLETGALGEESLFGYDFSQGYSSLERGDPPSTRKRRPNAFQRWRQRRAAQKRQKQEEKRQAEEDRMDALLAKVQSSGLQSLTEEERRFLTRVSARYRNKNQS